MKAFLREAASVVGLAVFGIAFMALLEMAARDGRQRPHSPTTVYSCSASQGHHGGPSTVLS